MKYSKHVLCTLFATIFLSACSTEEDPIINVAPSISVPETIVVEEGTQSTILLKVSDDVTPVGSLAVTFGDAMFGELSYDKGTSQIIYKASWISGIDEKELSDVIEVTVTDGGGESTKIEFPITITDIDSPVSITYGVASVSDSGSKAEITKRYDNSNVDIYVTEGQSKVVLPINVYELDADEVSFDYSGGNFITREDIVIRGDGEMIYVEFSVPEISSSSEGDTFKLSFSDNDSTLISEVNILIANEFTFAWDMNKGSNSLRESTGGFLAFKSDQPLNYSFTYTAELMNEDGSEILFAFPDPILDKVERTISFPQFEIDGSKQIRLILTVDDGTTIKEIKTTLYLVDDIDQDFDSILVSYYDNLDRYEDIKTRNDEFYLADIISKYLVIEDLTTVQNADKIVSKVNDAFLIDINAVESSIAAVTDTLDDGGASGDVVNKIAEFNLILADIGESPRQLIIDELAQISSNTTNFSEKYKLGKFSASQTSRHVSDYTLSSYVGNVKFGYYSDENKSEWNFLPEYGYMKVLNVLTSQCF
jgi:hypothetical protein